MWCTGRAEHEPLQELATHSALAEVVQHTGIMHVQVSDAMLLPPYSAPRVKGVYTPLCNTHNLAIVQHIAGWVVAYPNDWHLMSVAMLAMPPPLAPVTPPGNYHEYIPAAVSLQANMQVHLQSLEYPNGQPSGSECKVFKWITL